MKWEWRVTPGPGDEVDLEGVRTIFGNYLPEGAEREYELRIDTEEQTGIDIAVKTGGEGLGNIDIQKDGAGSWTPLTNDLSTTWTEGNVTAPVDVNLRVRFTSNQSEEYVVWILFDKVGGIV